MLDEDGNEFLEELQRVLDYNPEVGEFRWKVAVANRVKPEDKAGTVRKSDGRLYISFKSKQYLAHRLAWLLTYGKWPEKFIDHIDGNPLNNRINNLRDVSNEDNCQNRRKAQVNNKSEILGAHYDKKSGLFKSSIRSNGKQKHLGYFLTAEEAHTTYIVAKRKLHEGNTL
ncbi:MAG: HNH endonuclease signature motif containing protein [Waterburya sp.]